VPVVPRNGILAMQEKNIDISGHISRRYDPLAAAMADVVVNMSDYRLSGPPLRRLIEWKIVDPYGQPIAAFRKTRDVIEQKVMSLILSLRRSGVV
jgi:protein-tyrosine-phosphatase